MITENDRLIDNSTSIHEYANNDIRSSLGKSLFSNKAASKVMNELMQA